MSRPGARGQNERQPSTPEVVQSPVSTCWMWTENFSAGLWPDVTTVWYYSPLNNKLWAVVVRKCRVMTSMMKKKKAATQTKVSPNQDKSTPDSACWCVAKLPRKTHCPDAGALSLLAALAKAGKIYSTAARFKKCDFSRFAAKHPSPTPPPPPPFSTGFILIRNAIRVWDSAATTDEGALGGGRETLARTRTRTSTHTAEGTSNRLREELGVWGWGWMHNSPADSSSLTGTLLMLLPFITHHSEAFDKTIAAGRLLGRHREYVMNDERARPWFIPGESKQINEGMN